MDASQTGADFKQLYDAFRVEFGNKYGRLGVGPTPTIVNYEDVRAKSGRLLISSVIESSINSSAVCAVLATFKGAVFLKSGTSPSGYPEQQIHISVEKLRSYYNFGQTQHRRRSWPLLLLLVVLVILFFMFPHLFMSIMEYFVAGIDRLRGAITGGLVDPDTVEL